VHVHLGDLRRVDEAVAVRGVEDQAVEDVGALVGEDALDRADLAAVGPFDARPLDEDHVRDRVSALFHHGHDIRPRAAFRHRS
jgi:hypothetical protein